MDTRAKLEWIVDYMTRSKPGLLVILGVVLLVSGYFTNNGNVANVGLVFFVLAVVIAVVIEAEVWAWKKVDKRRNGALSSR
jgi:hypothetical protein